MFDLSWGEILMIGAVAIIFIGPKELPGTLRMIGRFVNKARAMAREFQGNLDDMMRETEIDELQKQVQKVGSGDFAREIEKSIDPEGEMSKALAAPDLSPGASSGNDAAARPAIAAPAEPDKSSPAADAPARKAE
ncbi:MAG: twin-arginine translocase subunit TatB [Rhodospirillales bacterium]|nr:twin-arginine translocase subunit TatB [Rhodospirillales bacterium]